MSNNWAETIGSINGYVKTLAKEYNVFMATFDNISYDIVRNSQVAFWEDVSPTEITPRGGTPLYDSSARMMYRILDDKAEKALFLVMTDGEENQSNHFNQSSIKSLVNQLDARKYETVFLGANFDKVQHVADTYARGWTKTANMTTGNMNNFMAQSLSVATASYAAGNELHFTDAMRSVGDTNAINQKTDASIKNAGGTKVV